MPEELSQAASQEQVTPESVIVPEPPTPPASAQSEQPTDKPLTAEDYRKIAREEAIKIAQSQTAKSENRIQKQIQERFAALEQTKGALNLTDQQVSEAKQKIVSDAYSSPEDTTQTTPTEQPASPDTDQAISYMNAQIQSVFAEVGTAVTKADPEFKELQDKVNAAWNDPNGLAKILLTAHKVATAKAARLQTQQNNAAGRVIGGGQTNSGQVQQPKDAHAAWGSAYDKQ